MPPCSSLRGHPVWLFCLLSSSLCVARERDGRDGVVGTEVVAHAGEAIRVVLEDVGFWRDLHERGVSESCVLCHLGCNGIVPFPVGAVPVAEIVDAVVKRVRLHEGERLLVRVCVLPKSVLFFRVGEHRRVVGVASPALPRRSHTQSRSC